MHELNLQRAYQFVCYLVGFNQDKFKPLAAEVKLPRYRQESCTEDYNKALNAWESVLKPHWRAPDQQKTNIDVACGDGRGKQLEVVAKASRDIRLLEPCGPGLRPISWHGQVHLHWK